MYGTGCEISTRERYSISIADRIRERFQSGPKTWGNQRKAAGFGPALEPVDHKTISVKGSWASGRHSTDALCGVNVVHRFEFTCATLPRANGLAIPEKYQGH